MEIFSQEQAQSLMAAKKKTKDFFAIIIILAGLFVGSLFVDFVQLALGRGFSSRAVEKHMLLETGGKTWVAYDDPKVTVQIVTDTQCTACDPSEALVWLRRVLPTLEAVPIESTSEMGKLLIERFQLIALPAFIFSGSVVDTDFYAQASSLFEAESGRYFFDMGKIGLPAGKYLTLPRIDETDIMVGPQDAPVKIVEYADFQCPYCKAFHTDMNTVLKEYSGKILFVYKHLPLPIHSQAENAALAGSCANEQGKFLVYADHLFAKQSEWSNTGGLQKFKDYAWRLGLNGRQFTACLESKKYQDTIDADTAEAENFSISGTPGIFVNDVFFPGVIGLEALKETIDAELLKAEK